MHKKCKCKNAMQNKYKSKKYCKFKNANCRKCFWTPAWFTFRGRAGYAVSVAWFSCIQVLEFASHAICARMSFSSVWVSVPASTLEWVHRFSGKGWWLAQPPSPSPKRCFSGKWGPISQGMTLPRAHLFCFLFAFVLLFCLLFCCFFCFFIAFFCFVFTFYLSFLRFLSKSIQFRRSPIRIGDLPFRLVTCPLGRREPQHWAFFFGFTGSPRTSLFKFNASFVFCAGFTTLSRLICCFHVCCIWHFPFSLVAFPMSPHMMSPPSNLHWLLPCILHLSNVPPSKLHLLFLFFLHLQFLPLFNLHFAFPFFLQLSCVPLSDLHFPIPFFLHCFSFFFKMHPRTSAIRQHNPRVC